MSDADRMDRKAADREEAERFEQIQRFVTECRRHWPGSKIVIRASDAACVDLSDTVATNPGTSEMQTSDFYSSENSKYLRASDLIGKELTPTIARVTRCEFTTDNGGKAIKPVVEFEGGGPGLVVNKTNLSMLEAMLGNDMDGWPGEKIRLYGDRVPFRGKVVDTVRVGRPEAPSAHHQMDDEVPF
jgi:hypothetical protein